MKQYINTKQKKINIIPTTVGTVVVNSEFNALKAGASAFRARVPFYNNPYKDNHTKSAWIRGYKRAERAFNEAIKLSLAIQATIGFEEVEI